MKRFALVLALGLFGSVPAFAQSNPCNPDGKMAVNACYAKMGTVFHIDDPMGRNAVTFKSEAPLEDIVGTTSQISGYLVFNPEEPKKGGRGELVVSTASLNTGIPLRDEHLQSADWLNAGAHPTLKLDITNVSKVKKVKSSEGAQTYDVRLTTALTLAGKTVRMEIPGRITHLKESDKTRSRMPGDLLAARASFDVKLSDFDISGPAGMDLVGNKVGETISIDVSLMSTTAKPMMAENPCNPCGGKASNPCNPCGDKAAANPCNPCGGKAAAASNPCNPCGGKAVANPCNPCGGNPCNPCGGKAAANPCNPCSPQI